MTFYDRIFSIYPIIDRFIMPSKRQFVEYISTKGEISVLDVGMGPARWWKNCPSINFTGIDTSIKMVNYVKNKHPKATVVKGSAEQLPFDDQTFNIVVLAHVLSVIDNPKKAYHEAKRVTKHGGEIIIINHDSKGWEWLDIPLSWFSGLVGVKLPFYLDEVVVNNESMVSSKFFGFTNYFSFLRLK